MTVADLSESLTARELTEWVAYDSWRQEVGDKKGAIEDGQRRALSKAREMARKQPKWAK